ncbi:MAG: hypothetical protein ABIP50_00975 [Candidatus Saccharimonadales bacterium]
MAGLPQNIETALTEVYGPVEAAFIITQIPKGGAPEDIKEQWVGVSLPVRAAHLGQTALAPTRNFDYLTQQITENDDSVAITGIDAVHALAEAGKESAARFWDSMQLAKFVFRAHEGTLQPLQSD